MSHEEMLDTIESSDIVITHAGSGAIISAVKKKKYVICVPRFSRNMEHNDDHQVQISKKFTELGYIKSAYSYEEFVELFDQQIPLKYPQEPESNLQNTIFNEISELVLTDKKI
jgi:UDP-N-acetylglucosamine transferase subunit ALG13